jgi:hypothetical protein
MLPRSGRLSVARDLPPLVPAAAFVINLKTAKTLSLAVSPDLPAIADEVVE